MICQKITSVLFGVLCLAGLAMSQEDTVIIDENYRIRGGELKLDLEVDGGEVRIVRNDSGDECHVLMEYSKDKCEGDVRFDERHGELEVNLDFENWGMFKKHGDGPDHAEVTIELPKEPDIDLRASIKAGEIEMILGDLHLRNFELRNLAGEVTVDFDEPNRAKLNTFDVNVKVGETSLLHLGNANFEEADINGGIGEMKIDFSGEKIDRAMARIDLDIGETTITVPEKVGTKMRVSKFLFLSEVKYPRWFEQRGKYYYSENYRENDKSLYLLISTGIGELRIRVERDEDE